MFGKILVFVVFGLAFFSTLSYFLSYQKNKKLLVPARWLYYAVTAGMVGISMYLLSNIVSHNFQFTYIWENSSLELPTNFLIATFYSGQQGSFLLWGLMMSIIGFILVPFLKKEGYEPLVMGFYSLILLFVLVILMIKSPFDYIWETFADAPNVKVGFMPENGRGLNPLLQNYWITIHPPILFLGYSCMSIPFAFAMAGIIKKDFRNWISQAFPWTLLACGILALGLMLGGFWAYETLGWGGFWAWDPVENSSLIPWLVCVALVHTMLVTRTTGGLLKTNVVLASFCFLMVLYATFLTRSGVLGDTSVHSFVSPGPMVYKFLLIFLITFFIISFGLFLWRMKSIPRPNKQYEDNSKEFYISLGSIVILSLAFITILGTSSPIFADLLGMKKASVETKWYNMINTPIAVLMLILNVISVYLNWRTTPSNTFFKKALIPLSLSGLFGIVLTLFGVRDIFHVLLGFSAMFVLISNIEFLYLTLRKSPIIAGGFIAHLGVALVMIGALTSGGYSEKQQVRLKEGESKTAFGYTIKHEGKTQIEKYWTDRIKYKYNISIEKYGSKDIVNPIVYWSNFNEKKSPFFEPGIKTFSTYDIYLSPFSLELEYKNPPAVIQKGGTTFVPYDSSIQIQLLKFDMSGAQATMSLGYLNLGNVIKIKTKDGEIQDTIYLHYNPQEGMGDPIWKKIGKTNYEIGWLEIMPNKQSLAESKVVYSFRSTGAQMEIPSEVFTMEVTKKPFILLVWGGTIVIILGFFWSMYRNIKSTKALKGKEPVEIDDLVTSL